MDTKVKAILASYIRAFIVAALAVYGTGETNAKHLLLAGLVAIAGPAIRAINPKDKAFGLVADGVDKELKELVKKSTGKKKTK